MCMPRSISAIQRWQCLLAEFPHSFPKISKSKNQAKKKQVEEVVFFTKVEGCLADDQIRKRHRRHLPILDEWIHWIWSAASQHEMLKLVDDVTLARKLFENQHFGIRMFRPTADWTVYPNVPNSMPMLIQQSLMFSFVVEIKSKINHASCSKTIWIGWLWLTTKSVCNASLTGYIFHTFHGILLFSGQSQQTSIFHVLRHPLQETQWFVKYDWHCDFAQFFTDTIFQNRPNAEIIAWEHGRRQRSSINWQLNEIGGEWKRREGQKERERDREKKTIISRWEKRNKIEEHSS